MTRVHHPWSLIIKETRRLPNKWAMTLPDVPARLEKKVRLREHPDLRRDDGRLEAHLRNVYEDDDGHKRGDLFLRWVPSSPHDKVGSTP